MPLYDCCQITQEIGNEDALILGYALCISYIIHLKLIKINTFITGYRKYVIICNCEGVTPALHIRHLSTLPKSAHMCSGSGDGSVGGWTPLARLPSSLSDLLGKQPGSDVEV